MNYIGLSILYIIILNKNIEVLTLFLTITILILFFTIKKVDIQFFLESNLSYNENIELEYLLTNIAINSIFFIQLFYIFLIKAKNYKYSYRIAQLTKNNLFFIENILFYSIYVYNTYYSIQKEYIFLLHENIVSIIHPILTLISLILFLISVQKIKKKNKIWLTYYSISMTIILGMIWAITTEGWGGAWVWDPTEIILLFFLILLLFLLHFKNYNDIYFIRNWTFFIILYYIQINKLHLMSGIHNFYLNNTQLSIYYWYIILLVYISILIILTKNYKKRHNFINKYMLTFLFTIVVIFYLTNFDMYLGIFIRNLVVIKKTIYIIIISITMLNVIHINNKLFTIFILIIIILSTKIQLFDFKILLLIVCMYIIIDVIKANNWISQNHIVPLIWISIVTINFIEFENTMYYLINIMLSNVNSEYTFNEYILQKSNQNLQLSTKLIIKKSNLFLEETIDTFFLFSNKKNTIYQYQTNLFSIITNSISRYFEYPKIQIFNNYEINLFKNKTIGIISWVILIIYIKKKW